MPGILASMRLDNWRTLGPDEGSSMSSGTPQDNLLPNVSNGLCFLDLEWFGFWKRDLQAPARGIPAPQVLSETPSPPSSQGPPSLAGAP